MLLAPLPVAAQTQTVVVPGGSGVVIGPRSQAIPRSTLAPPARPQQRFVVATPQGDTLTGPSIAAAVGLAGAAALAVVLGGGSGGGGSGGGSTTAATSRTR
ncbi:hypothetical protein [Roseomonas sp. CECT 9278]|uniref:hypothetical protein n=1 Tax=Roseomonas sp. CECT 9278 TaxID=2845823 RepID=UPI001E629FD4|nr:hypothetical protein [Roseomonas sp. CECT 9278]